MFVMGRSSSYRFALRRIVRARQLRCGRLLHETAAVRIYHIILIVIFLWNAENRHISRKFFQYFNA